MESFICLGVGACIVAMGIYQIVSGNPRLLHSYHYATTPASELPALARETGIGLVACGIGCMLITPEVLPTWCLGLGIALMVLSVAGTIVSIVRHNGGLITGGEMGFLSSMAPGTRLAVCGIIGAALSLIGIGPGIYMIATGDVSMLHSYHYAGVAAADLPRLATCEGVAMIFLGISIFMCLIATAGFAGGRPFKRWPKVLVTCGMLLFCASMAALLLFIPYFGGSLNP